MRPILVRVQAIAGAAIVLAGCGLADSHSALPKFLRQAEQQTGEQEAPPDVRHLVRANMASLFVASANPRDIAVSPARHVPQGPGWRACIKANVNGMSNQSIGIQTFVIAIENGRIWNRHRAGAEDNCDSETYEPL